VLRKRNIEWEEPIPYAHHQMGVIKRANRTIGSIIKILLIDTQLPEYLWPELFDTVLYLKNRSPNKAVRGMTPYEALHGSPKRQRKLKPKARKLRLISYGKGTNQYKAWNPETNRIENVTFIRADESDTQVSQKELNQSKFDEPEINDSDYDESTDESNSEDDISEYRANGSAIPNFHIAVPPYLPIIQHIALLKLIE
jgi:hypothetical protein